MAAGVSRFGNRGRRALPQFTVRDEKFPAAICLSLPELQTGISARAKDSPHNRMSRLLPKTQRWRFRSAFSAQTRFIEPSSVVLLKRRLARCGDLRLGNTRFVP